VVTDIHGCANTFSLLLEKAIKLKKSDTLYLLGDYIDRGPDSKRVLDDIRMLSKDGYEVIALRGNHEQMLIEAYDDQEHLDIWLRNGGNKTLDSFGVSSITQIPEEYLSFLKSLPYYHTTERFILVHAGLNFDLDDPLRDKEAMLWRRKFEVDLKKTGGRGVIHGHTPISMIQIHEELSQYSIRHQLNLDNGCVFGMKEFYGKLCALELENLKIHWHDCMEQA
jgi:serine/threonine protein phosphatase 1